MTIGLGTGPLFVASLGSQEGIAGSMEFAVMGQTMSHMARAEDLAAAGEIFLDAETYQAVDTAMEWFGWGLSWLLKIIAVLTMQLGVGAGFFLAAQGVDFITAMARTAVCIVLTFPDVLGFQMDTLNCAWLFYHVAIEGQGSLDNLFEEA